MTATLDLTVLSQAAKIELAYLARSSRLVNPDGKFDNAGRWYPDEDAEGGTPVVRGPSRAWPYSYMVACRTKKWCAQLPEATLNADAGAAVRAILDGKLELSDRLAKIIAKG